MLSIVVPVWNEESNIGPFVEEISSVFAEQPDYEIIFVLDPCTDKTEFIIDDLAESDSRIKSIVMSRRYQPMATLAGLERCVGDCAVVMDVDLQDPPELLPKMIDLWRKDMMWSCLRDALWRESTTSLLLKQLINSLINLVIFKCLVMFLTFV